MAVETTNQEKKVIKKILMGEVVSDKMEKNHRCSNHLQKTSSVV